MYVVEKDLKFVMILIVIRVWDKNSEFKVLDVI